MKIRFGVENLRSIEKMEPIELRPITILVGANGSGKSTYLQSISLLRQSLETLYWQTPKLDEPILWRRNGSVDFGDFDTARTRKTLSDDSSTDEISFNFEIDSYDLFFNLGNDSLNQKKHLKKIYYNVKISKINEKLKISNIEFGIKDYNLNFDKNFINDTFNVYKDEKIIMGNSMDNFIDFIVFNDESLFKGYYINDEEIIAHSTITPQMLMGIKLKNLQSVAFLNFINFIISEFSDVDKNIISNEAIKIALSYPLCENTIQALKDNAEGEYQRKIYDKLLEISDIEMMKELNKYSALFILFHTFSHINDDLTEFFMSSKRIGPIRNLSDRYYEIRQENVEEISVNSKNVPMILAKMKDLGELEIFSNWLNEQIGYEIDIDSDSIRLELSAIRNGLKVNLSDSGFGITQVLPILAQIWLNTIGRNVQISLLGRRSFYEGKMIPILIEQPELNLHPKHQECIANALVSSITSIEKKPGEPQQLFVVETHSEILVNRLGALVRKEKISKEKLQIATFEMREDNSTDVQVSTFNSDGSLNNWPYNFFDY